MVCVLGGHRGVLDLPESVLVRGHPAVSGGERSLYEIAVAAAAAGFEVELRGAIDEAILDTITIAAGVAPRVELPARRAEPDEVLIVPEAAHPDLHLAAYLSGAATVVMILAPPGLAGWDFTPGWVLADPHTVPLDAVGTSIGYRTIDSLGVTLWTNAHGIAKAGKAAGVDVTWIGTGTPVPFPDTARKTFDVAVVENNRWYEQAAKLAGELVGVSVLSVAPRISTYSLSSDLAPARLLVWPSRIEGMSRIAREARGVGTVPVALDTNPFVARSDHGDGVVLVRDDRELVERARELLADPGAIDELAHLARAGARAQVEWLPFVQRVRRALENLGAPRLDAHARGIFGARLEAALLEARSEVRVRRLDALLREKNVLIQDQAAMQAHLLSELRETRLRNEALTGRAISLMVTHVDRLIGRIAPWGTRRRSIFIVIGRAMRVLSTRGWKIFIRRLSRPRHWAPQLFRKALPPSDRLSPDEQYRLWVQHHIPTGAKLRASRADVERLAYQPKISIVMPTYNSDPELLWEALESVRQQIYENWELCIADDGSTRSDTRKVIEACAKRDQRIKVAFHDVNRGIAAASNEALAMARGEFVGFLDHDDELRPIALSETVKLLNQRRDLDYIYTDEDKKDPEGRLTAAFFKPDWSPDFLMSANYVTHFSVYRREVIEEVGGLREGYEGSQDYDLVLRVTELTDRIGHIPLPVYTWRMAPQSAAASDQAKPYAYESGKRALSDALARRGLVGEVLEGPGKGYYRVRYQIEGDPKVSIVIPTRDKVELLRRCVDSVQLRSTYQNYEIIVVDNDSREPETLEFLASFDGRVIRWPDQFNFSSIVNLAAREAESEYLLILNNDTEVVSWDWIEAMLEHAQRPEVAAVGARLLFPDGRVQHEGIILRPKEGNLGLNIDHRGYFGLGRSVHNCSAVTGACLMTRSDVFRELGGFEERLWVSFNDVDYCLRAREKGYLIVYTPHAVLYHAEGGTRGRAGRTYPESDEEFFRARWADYVDPYFNPNFDIMPPHVRLRDPAQDSR